MTVGLVCSKLTAMKFSQWLDSETGRATKVAQHFDVTLSAVSQWRTNGVPYDNMKEVRALSNDDVSLEEMLDERSKV